MKTKEKKVVVEDILLDSLGSEATLRDILVERLKFENYFSPQDIRFVESSQASN